MCIYTFIYINLYIYIYIFFYISFLVVNKRLVLYVYHVNVCFILCEKCMQENELAILPLSSHALRHTSALFFFSLSRCYLTVEFYASISHHIPDNFITIRKSRLRSLYLTYS